MTRPDFLRSPIPWILAFPPTAILAISIAVLLSGCASTFDYQWVKVREPIPLDRRSEIFTTAMVIEKACGKAPRVSVHTITTTQACAMSTTTLDWCFIYLPVGAPKWMIEHEHKHCDGYIHP